jgi:hypothetical protein
MYADATKRHEYRLRVKRWNGFQAIYDETDVELGEFSIRFSKVILPEMASLRFVVSEEDGTFIGQSFIPVAHLRPGYRHIVLRNQMNIPVQCSSLFIYIRKDVHVDAQNKELIDQLVSPTSVQSVMKEQIKYKPLSEQRSLSAGDVNTLRRNTENEIKPIKENFVSPTHSPSQHHYPSTTDINVVQSGFGIHNKKWNQSTPFVDANWHQNQLTASSQLHDTENLCRELSLNDVEQTKPFKRKQEAIEAKVRRTSLEYDKVWIYFFN